MLGKRVVVFAKKFVFMLRLGETAACSSHESHVLAEASLFCFSVCQSCHSVSWGVSTQCHQCCNAMQCLQYNVNNLRYTHRSISIGLYLTVTA